MEGELERGRGREIERWGGGGGENSCAEIKSAHLVA